MFACLQRNGNKNKTSDSMVFCLLLYSLKSEWFVRFLTAEDLLQENEDDLAFFSHRKLLKCVQK